jgi:hypothetical protein
MKTVSIPLNLVGAMHFDLEDGEALTMALIDHRLQSIRSMLDAGDMQSSGDARLSVAVDGLDKQTQVETYENRSTDWIDWPTV